MTGIATSIGTLLAAGAIAVGGALGGGQDDRAPGGAQDGRSLGSAHDVRSSGAIAQRDDARTALVVDASRARRGRELVDPRLRDLDAEVRLPRTAAEARTNVRYFDALGYRVVVAGPQASAAAAATGVDAERAADLAGALRAARR